MSHTPHGTRRSSVIAVISLLLLVLAQPVIAYHATIAEAGTASVRARINVPAVTEDGDSSIISVDVELSTPGNGSVLVVSEGEIDETTESSMRMAVATGLLMAGVNFMEVNAVVRINTRGLIAGPSGSFGVALATYLLASGLSPQIVENYAVTGAISPDGLASRVGAVALKCRAAEREGLFLMYPLANLSPALSESCSGGTPTPGIINATLTLAGTGGLSLSVAVSMPDEFEEAMREAVRNLTRELRGLAEREGLEIPSTVDYLINQSLVLSEDHPYAAASYAYRALLGLYTVYYTMLLTRGSLEDTVNTELARLSSELSRLEAMLSQAESSGSIYYIEMRATAYTRLAEAYSTLQRAQELVSIGASIDEIASLLATARARVASIESWISTSERLAGKGPLMDEESLARLEKGLRMYVETSVDYASSLIRYSIKNYVLPEPVKAVLRVYLDSVRDIMDRAESYRERGNLVASIGFLREALSESLSTIFTLSATQDRVGIIQGYLDEIRNIYGVLLARVASKGYPGGLAPAYADYSLVLLNEDPRAAVGLMEEAIASAILWNILVVTALSGGGGSSGVLGGALVRAVEDPVLTAIIAMVSYSIGVVASTLVARMVRRGRWL